VQKGELPILRGHVLDEEDQIIRRHVLNLMTQMKTDWSERSLFSPYLETVAPRLEEFIRDGLIELTPTSCTVKEKGRPFLRNVCMAFDARLTRQAPATQLFSKTI
jgi:oxygen-independent coproporphyrinogen-3 oxidase